MKFLIDESISPFVAVQLRIQGHDAVHVHDIGLTAANDLEIFRHAETDGRVIIAADTDYGHIIASLRAPGPSLILFRHEATDNPLQQVPLLRDIVSNYSRELNEGSIVVLDGQRIRIRSLPISD